ncbi:hypothetical protein LU631_14380 [Erwinia tracheiphila]|uniref:Uncharacterized protein n=1 Tax=Erwinia tracheiphila TaxID=65700 RepID=A0A345CQS9_9GAMM|nr:hypothetical protein [Erwinia tracheiphila]AXF75796.1 hypothetical protein AV903_06325 [Erwinia tracheiphila]EOS93340.1 hypothetical protein ETR_19618 [Erwinia tracheiphila PSU-1]UIA85556.1 hypothetical protein LU604_12910 [Erwinia tracheiphila]UIA86245.1 hypothetical protein LU631_14380 [Erwinia tracheiphila]UIA94077.1 hypothetical protein LU632_12475 [Erwinia tracheiphila]
MDAQYAGQITVLCAAPETMASTRGLFSAFIDEHRLSVMLIPGAWQRFMQQDIAAYVRQPVLSWHKVQ